MTEIKAQFDLNLRKSIKKKKQVAVIPIGSIEQHGPHLPVSTDSDIVTEVAKSLSEKKAYLLLPTLTYGVSFEHAPFFNLSIRESTLLISAGMYPLKVLQLVLKSTRKITLCY